VFISDACFARSNLNSAILSWGYHFVVLPTLSRSCIFVVLPTFRWGLRFCRFPENYSLCCIIISESVMIDKVSTGVLKGLFVDFHCLLELSFAHIEVWDLPLKSFSFFLRNGSSRDVLHVLGKLLAQEVIECIEVFLELFVSKCSEASFFSLITCFKPS